MDILGKKEIQSLIDRKYDRCVSIYLPVHPLGDRQDSIRYRNLVAKAEEELIGNGMRSADALKLLASEYDLSKRSEYWKNIAAEGLAVFLADGFLERYPLPVKFSESVTVAGYFGVKPLIPLLTGDGRFFILSLSRGEIHLFLASRYTFTEVPLPAEMPKNMEEVLRYDDPQKQLQFHTKTASTGSKRQAMFHGHGVGIDDQQDNMIRYVRQIDLSLYPLFFEEKSPVVLVGDIQLRSAYREHDSSGMLLAQDIDSYAEAMSQEALHDKAWQCVAPHFAEEEKKAREVFEELQGTQKTSSDSCKIAALARGGRVETLFAVENEELWGVFDPTTDEAVYTQKESPGAIDLIECAVAWTIKTNGTVYIKKQEDIPGGHRMAAILRY